jgi:predicted protein tyrosine phosphatase
MIRVTDYPTAERIRHEFDHVIGLLDPCMERDMKHLHPSIHMFWFTDTVHGGLSCPKLSDIRRIVDAFKTHDMGKGNILVHCMAGLCRSTATAIGLLVMQGIRPEDAFKIIHDQRPRMWPNELILKHFDTALGLGTTLVDADKKWKSQQPKLIWD